MTASIKILCIGKSGQVARALKERSAAAGYECECIGRPDHDILQSDSLSNALDTFNPSLVVNAAAYTNVDGAEEERDAAFALNGTAPGVLARHCAARDLPLIHISTDYVFDGRGKRAWCETDPTNPVNAYGESKLAGEAAVKTAMTQYIILRTSWVYSPFGTNFLKTMLKLAEERSELSVVDDQVGAPTGALDIADAILSIVAKISTSDDFWGTYHYAASGHGTWADFAQELFDIFERSTGKVTTLHRIPSYQYPTPAARPANSRLNTNKFSAAFGHIPLNWVEGVREIAERYLSES